MKKINTIKVKDYEIAITGINEDDYISLTDIAKIKSNEKPADVIIAWIKRVETIKYLTLWEQLNNENFKLVDFNDFKSKPGENAFTMSPQRWILLTNAIGIRSKRGKYGGGTFAHRDIALEFASWISPEIRLYIIKEFQRLKIKESEESEWRGNRLLSKINYLMHTDAVKKYLVPVLLSQQQINYIYASEADMLNVALFGKKAKDFKEENPELKGNMRDYASILELAILANLEYKNSELIRQGLSQKERLIILNKDANEQKELFNNHKKKICRDTNIGL